MTIVTRSIPGLFGGVSQQIPAMRHPTHCSEQENALATLVAGLFKRPGSRHLATLPLTSADGFQSLAGSAGAVYAHVIESRGNLYQLVLANGNFLLYNMANGAVQQVSFPNGKAYLAAPDPENDFRCVTVADYTFLVNRRKTVAMQTVTTPPNPGYVAYIYIKTAVVKTDYKAIINGVEYKHTTGDTATSWGISAALAQVIQNALGGQGYTAFAMQGNIIKVTRVNQTAFTCTANDGWANQATQTLHQGVTLFSDLPQTFEEGYVVTVNGAADGDRDAYYVKWSDGRWTECAKPGIKTKLDPATMPHQLRQNADGTWVFEQCSWADRRVGDDETNPVPSFVDTTVRNVFFFRNRLGFLSDDAVVLSRAGQYFTFWGKSGTQVLGTDPIHLGATSEQVVALEWAVPYNQTLILWAADKQQFVLTGGDILSPNNARLMPSTTFEWFKGVRPVSLGNKVLFTANLGSFSQVNLFRVSDDTVTNTADDVTEHCPEYVPASPRMVAASHLVKAAVVVPAGPTRELYVFKYELDKQDALTQKEWCRIHFETADTVRIIHAHWSSRTLYLLKHVITASDPASAGRYALEMIDFSETAQDTNVGFGLRLDCRVQATPATFDGANTIVDVPYLAPVSELALLKCAAGSEPVPLVVVGGVADTVNLRTRVTVQGDQRGAFVWAGRKYTMRYRFTEVYMRDGEGLPVMAANVKLARITVRYEGTGWFTAKVTPMLRSTYTYPFSGRTIGQPGQGPTQRALSSGDFQIPVQAKAANTDVVIESDSYLPCKFPYAEWTGDVTMKAQR